MKIEEPVVDTVDIVGYRFNDSWPITPRMWRNASARSKSVLLAVFAVMAIYFTAAGAYAWQANESVANEIRLDRAHHSRHATTKAT